jgi:hypothetical protein
MIKRHTLFIMTVSVLLLLVMGFAIWRETHTEFNDGVTNKVLGTYPFAYVQLYSPGNFVYLPLTDAEDLVKMIDRLQVNGHLVRGAPEIRSWQLTIVGREGENVLKMDILPGVRFWIQRSDAKNSEAFDFGSKEECDRFLNTFEQRMAWAAKDSNNLEKLLDLENLEIQIDALRRIEKLGTNASILMPRVKMLLLHQNSHLRHEAEKTMKVLVRNREEQ